MVRVRDVIESDARLATRTRLQPGGIAAGHEATVGRDSRTA